MLNIIEFFRQWKAERKLRRYRLENPYRMLNADDGGQSYRMECVFCHEEENIMSTLPFPHALHCPAGKLEAAKLAAPRKKG